MFNVGDKVQIADNIESTKLRGMAGTIIQIDPLKVMYPLAAQQAQLTKRQDEFTEATDQQAK